MSAAFERTLQSSYPLIKARLLSCSADAMYEVVRLLPAAASIRLSRASHSFHTLLMDPLMPQWCAESRRALLVRRSVTGDLPLADVKDGEWTWARHA